MKQLLAMALVLGLLGLVLPAAADTATKSEVKEALQALQEFIGEWKGNGGPDKPKPSPNDPVWSENGAVDAGQVAVILGNSAVVNSSSARLPASGSLDAMRLSWGPYLWMRCYNNGAQFLDRVVGDRPDWVRLEAEARACPPGCGGSAVLPFASPEPSLGVSEPRVQWLPAEPAEAGKRFRAALEALAYLIARGVAEHEAAGQQVTRVTVSGGIARSDLMCEILASVLGKRLERLQSFEGPALGAAVTALAALENHRRAERGLAGNFGVTDAVACLVKFRAAVEPNPAWRSAYQEGLRQFSGRLGG